MDLICNISVKTSFVVKPPRLNVSHYRQGFPSIKIGSRVVIPKEKLIEWIDKNTGGKN